ncbi:MAG: hypothetical protein Q9212_002323 [Teloschistes hypoglaucus]
MATSIREGRVSIFSLDKLKTIIILRRYLNFDTSKGGKQFETQSKWKSDFFEISEFLKKSAGGVDCNALDIARTWVEIQYDSKTRTLMHFNPAEYRPPGQLPVGLCLYDQWTKTSTPKQNPMNSHTLYQTLEKFNAYWTEKYPNRYSETQSEANKKATLEKEARDYLYQLENPSVDLAGNAAPAA